MHLKNKFLVLITLSALFVQPGKAQIYAPPAGQASTTAMHKDSSAFIAWATGCESVRGLQDISAPSSGSATVGSNSMATGKAQTNAVLSLGDGGTATCTFFKTIVNGQGPDFAVFENGFDNLFLELAFVEVSSDGVNFVRFRSHSVTQTTTQTGSFGSTDATQINNLAGKYRGGYGTPFDLQELAVFSNININAITHVRIVDVVGSLNSSYATYDGYGNKINDPWPTAFPSGGFDLDAIGVIHEGTVTGLRENKWEEAVSIFPNPASQHDILKINSPGELQLVEVYDLSGKLVLSATSNEISISDIAEGLYTLRIVTENGVLVSKLMIRP